jgi:hypothetical protein
MPSLNRLRRILGRDKSPRTSEEITEGANLRANPPVEIAPHHPDTTSHAISSASQCPPETIETETSDGDNVKALTLWDRAYDSLREKNPKLVDEYEKLLSKELPQSSKASLLLRL